jgi:drug/metabolite transporter (DMT)-like permease
MICIFGTVTFLMKLFSFTIPRAQFLMYWYLGAFLGSIPLFYLEKQSPFQFPGRLIFLVPLASLAILGNLATLYWAFELTLASRVLPLTSAGYVFLPVLSGWFFFKERKGLSKREVFSFVLGMASVLLIILS